MPAVVHYALLLVFSGLILALTRPGPVPAHADAAAVAHFHGAAAAFFTDLLSLRLQLISSEIGVWVIRMAGISVFLEGNVIDLGSYQLEVAQACSGLRYLFPLMTLSVLIAYTFGGAYWKRTVVFLSSIPLTVLMNSVRIGIIGITVDRWGPGMAEGVLHEFEGWVGFMVSAVLVVLIAIGLNRLGRRKGVAAAGAATPAAAPAATGQPLLQSARPLLRGRGCRGPGRRNRRVRHTGPAGSRSVADPPSPSFQLRSAPGPALMK